MARKLKTYQTSQGFYDLAIAAPSMKAALEAWGANSNLFHQGFAMEADDPKIVAATLAKPGIVLRRPVGTKGPFSEEAVLPTDLDLEKPAAGKNKPAKLQRIAGKKARSGKRDDKAERAAALAYEKKQRRRDAEKRRQQAAAEKKRRKMEGAVEKARAAYDKAEREHEARIDALMAERIDLERREKTAETRWKQQRERLRDAVRKAGGG
jgi:hypothetical protein